MDFFATHLAKKEKVWDLYAGVTVLQERSSVESFARQKERHALER